MPRKPASKQLFGAHVSVAGGLHLAFDTAVELGCDCMQIFVKNQRQWTAPALQDETISLYKEAEARTGVGPVIAHGGYLINLGSAKKEVRDKSINALEDELLRCEALGIQSLVLHPGSHGGEGHEIGMERIVAGLDEVHKRTKGIAARVLLETTAGQGSSIGHEIEHLGEIIRRVADPERLHVCLDTCHLFAAGYNLADSSEYKRTVDKLAKEVTLDRIKCIHVNDSKTPLDGRVDRHAHIGDGTLALSAFRNLVNDKRLAKAPKIIETPKDTDENDVDMDIVNLKKLRGLIKR